MTTANTSSIKQVTVAGGGVLGSQIAMQNAFFGFNVTIFDKEPEKVKERIAKLMPIYAKFYDKSPCLLYTSPSPRDGLLSRMPSSA